jgi:hypothetical protein
MEFRMLLRCLSAPALLLITAASLLAAQLDLYDGARIHPPAPALPEGFACYGTADTTLDATAPDADFGGAVTLLLAPGTTRVLVRFDQLLPALGGPFNNITAATLTLSLAGTRGRPPAADAIRVYRLKRSWNEGGRDGMPNYWAATFNSRYYSDGSNALHWTAPGALALPDAAPLPKAHATLRGETLVVTGLEGVVRDALARHYDNFGILLAWQAPRSDAGLWFHSRETTNIALRPRLTLEYQPLPPARPAFDLGVTCIARYPEYYAWKDANSYEQKQFRGVDVGILKQPEFADVQKQPRPGDMLQYLGIVKNHGEQPVRGFFYRWRLNDTTVKTGVYDAVLAPQQQAYVWYSHPCPADFSDHRDEWLALRVEPCTPRVENKNNNELTIFTKARGTGVQADETSRAFYQSNYNAFGTYAFEDWLQFQHLYWNQIYMAKSRIRDVFPDGALPRVRIQNISCHRDRDMAGPVHVAFDWRDPRYDGMWGWDFGSLKDPRDLDKPDNFFRRTLRMCEPSLIHEMSHQGFGLMDVYWMTMEPAQNADTGAGGKVALRDPRNPAKFLTGVGYWPKYGGMMGGGDTRCTPDHEGTSLYADHDLCGLNQNAAYRGGFFGDYLYGIQTNIILRIVADDGTPAAGARLTAYQSTYWTGIAVIDDSKVVFSNVVTDARGEFVLPNQSTLEDGTVTTLTGHTLRDNPFGRIHVCGFNGNMLVHAEYGGKHYYYMIMVWEQNVRFAWGARDSDVRIWQLGPDTQLETYKHVY